MKAVYRAFVIVVIAAGAYIFGALGGAVSCMRHTEAESEKTPLLVLMYHNISPKASLCGKYCVNVKEFESDLKYLKENGFQSISVEQALEHFECGLPLPEKPVIITFDDGFEGFYIYAYPLLKQYGFKAAVNVVAAFAQRYTELEAMGNKDVHNPDYGYMTLDELREICGSGIVEIGNHTYDMHKLNKGRKGCNKKRGESTDAYKKALNADTELSQKILGDAVGYTPYIFAYPYGAYSSETEEILKQHKFKAIFNCTEKMNYISDESDLLSLCRYNRPSGISSAEFFKKIH